MPRGPKGERPSKPPRHSSAPNDGSIPQPAAMTLWRGAKYGALRKQTRQGLRIVRIASVLLASSLGVLISSGTPAWSQRTCQPYFYFCTGCPFGENYSPPVKPSCLPRCTKWGNCYWAWAKSDPPLTGKSPFEWSFQVNGCIRAICLGRTVVPPFLREKLGK